MRVTRSNLAGLNRKFRGYLKGSRVDEFFGTFGIKFAAGHWCAGDFCDRFAPAGYQSDNPGFSSHILEQMKRVARAGCKGIEFHESVFRDEKGKVAPSLVTAVRKALRDLGLTPTNMNNNLWSDPKWKVGSVCNPDARVRRDAVKVIFESIDIARQLGCSSVALWPGADGWDYNFQVNYGQLNRWFLDACVKINRAAKKAKLRFGIEAKLHEPREGQMIVATTQKAMLIASEVNRRTGGANMGVAIDFGHEQMYAYEPAENLYLAKTFGVPVVNFHVNNAKTHSNDEDRCAGTGDNWRLADFCYAAIDTGYAGWFGEDQFTYRMDPVHAMRLSREMFANVMKKALLIYARRDQLKKAQRTGDAGKTIDVVKEIIL